MRPKRPCAMENNARHQVAADEWRLGDPALMLQQPFRIIKHPDTAGSDVKPFRETAKNQSRERSGTPAASPSDCNNALLLVAARRMNLQVAGADDRRVVCAVSDLQHGAAAVRDAQVQHVAAAARFVIVYGSAHE